MPTIPSHPEGDPTHEPHRYRQLAESFGSEAERYDRTRPRYPRALVGTVLATSPGRAVLDVGCGTGIAARQFREAGCQVTGVDPDTRMAEFARRSGIPVEVSDFESWEPAGRMFDAVIAGQAWHWVDLAAGAARAARVLRPRGRLAVFWNVFELPPSLDAAVIDIYRRLAPGSPMAARTAGDGMRAYGALRTRAAQGIRDTGAFDEPEYHRFDWEQRYTREEWLAQLPTHAPNNQLPAATLRQLLAAVGEAIDAAGGAFTMRYATMALTAARRPAAATG